MDHFDLEDEIFLSQFENCTLDPAYFNHEAHLRLAWLMVKRHGLDAAIPLILKQLLNFVDHLSAREKFNKTLTVAAVKTVNHFMQKSKQLTFRRFLLEFPQLKNEFKKLIASHYTIDIFNEPAAKNQYLEPDILPFS